MIKVFRIILFVLAGLVGLMGATAMGYRFVKRQGIVDEYEMASSGSAPRILIATQASSFKDRVMKKVADRIKDRPFVVKVVDVTKIEDFADDGWNHIIVLSTIQSGKVSPELDRFLKGTEDYSGLTLLLTADSRTWAKKDIEIDAFTAASKKENVERYVDFIIAGIEKTAGR